MDRVDVVDSKNHERLLGSLERPALGPSEVTYSIIHLRRTPEVLHHRPGDCADGPTPVTRIHLRRVFLEKDGGWVKVGVLETDAPLVDLMRLRHFHLPGEGPREARNRQYAYL